MKELFSLLDWLLLMFKQGLLKNG